MVKLANLTILNSALHLHVCVPNYGIRAGSFIVLPEWWSFILETKSLPQPPRHTTSHGGSWTLWGQAILTTIWSYLGTRMPWRHTCDWGTHHHIRTVTIGTLKGWCIISALYFKNSFDGRLAALLRSWVIKEEDCARVTSTAMDTSMSNMVTMSIASSSTKIKWSEAPWQKWQELHATTWTMNKPGHTTTAVSMPHAQ